MNEQRKSYNDYMNPQETKRQQKIDELVSLGTLLLTKRSALSLPEIIYIDNVLHKQLNQRNAKIPDTVLRSIERKLNIIKEKYQRG